MQLKPSRNYHYDNDSSTKQCPECGEALVLKKEAILLAAKSEGDEGQFSTNMPTTRLCPNCPVAVFDKRELLEAAVLGLRKRKKIKFAVIGIIDLSVKEEVATEVDDRTYESVAPYEPLTPRIAPPKIGRNEKCPCGSGKKYKKCCLRKGE